MAFTLIINGIALILTLGIVQLLVFRHSWRTPIGQALLHFTGSLVLLQSAVLSTHGSLLAELPDRVVEGLANLVLASSFFIALAAFALLLHAGNAMEAAWKVVNRAGIIGIIVLQPALWHHDLFQFPDSLSKNLLGSSPSELGRVVVGVCVVYLILALVAGWRYRQQIDAPLLTGAVIVLVLVQLAELGIGALRELALTGIVGGIASSVLGYQFLLQLDRDPQTSQGSWLNVAHRIANILTINQPLDDTLSLLAEQIRQLARSDMITVMLPVGPDRLEVVTMVGTESREFPDIIGRQIRMGEGLAGRVMQTLYPMRIDNYLTWEGHAADFEDIPIHASMSIPLMFDGRLVGIMNASEIAPGRVFTSRDQMMLELLAPQVTVMIVADQLDRDLHTTHTYLQVVLDHTPTALLIFDSAGILRQANAKAQTYLRQWFDERVPSSIELAAQAKDTRLTDALVQWAIKPDAAQTLEVAYPSTGLLHVELQPIPNQRAGQPDLLIIFRAMSDLSST